MQDLSCLVWNVCLHWLDFRLRNWVHTRSESSSILTAWTIWRPLLPWCALSDRWMLLLHWGSCYHMITVVTSVSWCHPHQKWLSDKPPSSSLSMRWFLVCWVLYKSWNILSVQWNIQILSRNKQIVSWEKAHRPTSSLYRPQKPYTSTVSPQKLQPKRFVG